MDLKLKRGNGVFFLAGALLTPDTTSPGAEPGGFIDFTARPIEQQSLLIDNTLDDRQRVAVIYSAWTA